MTDLPPAPVENTLEQTAPAPRPGWRTDLATIIGPILLFGVLYVGATLALGLAVYPVVGAGSDMRATTAYSNVSLLAVLIASFVAVRISDHGRWNLGLFAPFPKIAAEALAGVGVATAVICLSDLLILATTNFRHVKGPGFDWWHVLVLFVPAAAHEELVFRGYPFQKLLAWNKTAVLMVVSLLFIAAHFVVSALVGNFGVIWIVIIDLVVLALLAALAHTVWNSPFQRFLAWNKTGAVFFGSLIFMAAHLGNPGVEWIGMTDVFVAGILLSLAYMVWNSLWFPIALHIWWNVLSGPILGHEVSGLPFNTTVLRTIDPGPAILTGGPFGIEASIFTLVLDIVAALVLMAVVIRRRNRIPLIGVSMETAVTSSAAAAAAGIEDLERQ